MQVYLATLESTKFLENMPDNYFDYGLVSYFYLRGKKADEKMALILSKVKNLLVDSGAHSLQHGKKVDYNEYTKEYIEYIKKWAKNEQVVGFFEMDVDNVLSYTDIISWRKRMEEHTDKIIPVWHKNRGIDEYISMCKEYAGRRVSITGFGGGGDVDDSQYNLFINTAHKYNCNVHILGMTRFDLIKTLNLHTEDSFDSSTWRQNSIFGNVAAVSRDCEFYRLYSLSGLRTIYNDALIVNFCAFNKLQKVYKEVNNSVYLKR